MTLKEDSLHLRVLVTRMIFIILNMYPDQFN